MIPTRLCSKGWFPYKALVAYQRCVDNPTINCEMGALSLGHPLAVSRLSLTARGCEDTYRIVYVS